MVAFSLFFPPADTERKQVIPISRGNPQCKWIYFTDESKKKKYLYNGKKQRKSSGKGNVQWLEYLNCFVFSRKLDFITFWWCDLHASSSTLLYCLEHFSDCCMSLKHLNSSSLFHETELPNVCYPWDSSGQPWWCRGTCGQEGGRKVLRSCGHSLGTVWGSWEGWEESAGSQQDWREMCAHTWECRCYWIQWSEAFGKREISVLSQRQKTNASCREKMIRNLYVF